jgi:hypothetical protein
MQCNHEKVSQKLRLDHQSSLLVLVALHIRLVYTRTARWRHRCRQKWSLPHRSPNSRKFTIKMQMKLLSLQLLTVVVITEINIGNDRTRVQYHDPEILESVC